MGKGREVVELLVSPQQEGAPDLLYALCDDATLWCGTHLAGNISWRRLNSPPQDQED